MLRLTSCCSLIQFTVRLLSCLLSGSRPTVCYHVHLISRKVLCAIAATCCFKSRQSNRKLGRTVPPGECDRQTGRSQIESQQSRSNMCLMRIGLESIARKKKWHGCLSSALGFLRLLSIATFVLSQVHFMFVQRNSRRSYALAEARAQSQSAKNSGSCEKNVKLKAHQGN